MSAIETWRARGGRVEVRGRTLFTVDIPSPDPQDDPVLIVHGFPTSSFDWRHIVDRVAERRRVLLVDLLGYGLSDKPDQPYSLFEQADLVSAWMEGLGVERAGLVTHDMGDSVGGELLARAMENALPFAVTDRVITNGSVYMDLVQLSAGQEFLLALPDRKLGDDTALDRGLFDAGIPPLFGAATQPDDEELDAMWGLLAHDEGDRLLPRLIRYIGERREHESRWTGAIERHPAPLTIVWGDTDPIAVFAMARRLADRRPDARFVRLGGIGHFPMIEAPDTIAEAILVPRP